MARTAPAPKLRSDRRPRASRRIMLVALVLASSLRLEAQEASFRVITHPDNPTTTLTRDEASRLFLRKTLTWKDGAKARPVDLGEKSQTRSSFTKEIHGKPMSSVKAYWINQLFTGRLDPPLEVQTD